MIERANLTFSKFGCRGIESATRLLKQEELCKLTCRAIAVSIYSTDVAGFTIPENSIPSALNNPLAILNPCCCWLGI